MKDWIKENIIDKGVENVRFWTKMHMTHYFPLLGLVYTTNDQEYWVECKVIEDRYPLEKGYKLTLQPLDERFSKEHFYQSDFESLVRDGWIVPKKSNKDHVEKVSNYEYIGCGLNIVTEGIYLVQ
jgi:hypothetical protein